MAAELRRTLRGKENPQKGNLLFSITIQNRKKNLTLLCGKTDIPLDLDAKKNIEKAEGKLS